MFCVLRTTARSIYSFPTSPLFHQIQKEIVIIPTNTNVPRPYPFESINAAIGFSTVASPQRTCFAEKWVSTMIGFDVSDRPLPSKGGVTIVVAIVAATTTVDFMSRFW